MASLCWTLLLPLLATLAPASPAFIPAPGAAFHQTAPTPPPTVPDFNLTRYLGRWYQLAAIPAPFQSDCTGGVRADYSLASGALTEVDVLNACVAANGTVSELAGR
eukprot:CAMPEP_0184718952 /NCGR_PEP_ID=MMETSP0314-20130426/7999_1 /TAXON_ID=38298 /ORGANISM="Rhodella maculata, Strain CCMP 736" /LENGTH=105 /DNA_ID=CAMNT_0027182769 /DNA_START=37 /DNA_END=350 /DNA_ORIENTATION=-